MPRPVAPGDTYAVAMTPTAGEEPRKPLPPNARTGATAEPAGGVESMSPMPARDAPAAMTPGSYSIARLEAATWEAFADLVERNNGIYGGAGAFPTTSSTNVG